MAGKLGAGATEAPFMKGTAPLPSESETSNPSSAADTRRLAGVVSVLTEGVPSVKLTLRCVRSTWPFAEAERSGGEVERSARGVCGGVGGDSGCGCGSGGCGGGSGG